MPNQQQHTKSSMVWDFARLLIRNRSLFQSEGEQALLDTLTIDTKYGWTFDDLLRQHTSDTLSHTVSTAQPTLTKTFTQTKAEAQNISQPSTTRLLKFFPTLLLVSSYLASHTQPKHDIILFSRLSSSSSHKRRYLSSTLNRSRVRKTPTKPKSPRAGGGGPSSHTDHQTSSNRTTTTNIDTDTTPSKKGNKSITAELDSGTQNPEKEKTHRSSRLLFEKTSSIPRPFPIERVVAILRAVHPDGIPRDAGRNSSSSSRGGVADKVYVEMAELEKLRLVVRAHHGSHVGGDGGAGGGGRGGGDEGVLEEKWRVNVEREVVVALGKRYGVGVDGWEID